MAKCFLPKPAGWFLAPLHCHRLLYIRGVSVHAGLRAGLLFSPLIQFSGGDGLCWRSSRGNLLLARKPDAWSHCLALPGRAGEASAGVMEQHAGAAGWAQAASVVLPELQSPWMANTVLNQIHSRGTSESFASSISLVC